METRQTDPIIAELRAIREAYAARFDYNVEAMFRDIRARQEASGREYVRLPARPTIGDKKPRDLDTHGSASDPRPPAPDEPPARSFAKAGMITLSGNWPTWW